jgi:hypothetical protein
MRYWRMVLARRVRPRILSPFMRATAHVARKKLVAAAHSGGGI